MSHTFKLLFFSGGFYILARLRKDMESGRVRIKNKTFHDIFFFNGYWEYRPMNIGLAVFSEIWFVIGLISLVLPLSENVRFVMLVLFCVTWLIEGIISVIIECVIEHKRKKEADRLGRFLKNMKKNG